MERMEKENNLPPDKKRRWIIATLLHMPPAYLGLTALKPLLPLQEDTITLPTRLEPLDLKAYGKDLKNFWRSYYPREAANPILGRIYVLERALIYGEAQQKAQVAYLLCHYLIALGNIRRYQGYSSALTYLSEAIALAEERGYWELYAKALYMRGYVYFDQWSLLKSATDLTNALEDFGRAYKKVKVIGISGPLKGAILAEWGAASASIASDREDRKQALDKIDQAGTIVSASGFKQDPYFLDINTEWYLIDKAEAFVKVGWPNSAREVLSDITKGNHRKRRRYITIDVIEAEAYAAKGNIDMAIALAESALDTAQNTQSLEHIARIINLYEQLRQPGTYANNPDVARLGIKLLKVRKPELFS